MRTVAPLLVLCSLLAACSSGPPTRYVVERDLGDYAYRRYQKVLDVEFPVRDNEAVGHTAHYVRGGEGQVHVASAFVTVYESAASLTAEIREQLDELGTYDLEVRKVDGEWVWHLDGGADRWLLWVSQNRLVKLGAPEGGRVPQDVASTYLDVYPSDLNEHGRARDGAESAGPARAPAAEGDDAPPMPAHLRQGAPQ